MPPADVLVRIADVAGVDLRWLLTGEGGGGAGVPATHPVLLKAAALLSRRPDSAQPLGAFLDILAATMRFPAKGGPARQAAPGASSPGPAQAASSTSAQDREAEVRPPQRPPAGPGSLAAGAEEERGGWIPILGRSAAGVPQFWSRDDDASGVRTLGELVARQGHRRPVRAEPASASGLTFGAERLLDSDAQGLARAPREALQDLPVQIVTLEGPDEGDVAEYVASNEMKARYGDAFAVRIDGESMSPEIRHGDLVVLSPSVPAAEGRPAVVQLHRQIGVTCKLFRREAGDVHLVPVNEQYAPQTFPAAHVAWALRVLATIRPARP